ncbi:MAG: magnesium transporter [Alphaproteobacteria bacterium]|nr:magnesium transporter [Alphaproteobacteria bacterium]
MLQVYSAEGGTLKALSERPDLASLGSAHWIDLYEPTEDEQQTVERALGIKLQAPDEIERFYISDQLRSSATQVTLKALLLAGLERHCPTLVPVTFIRSKGPLVTISRGSANGLAWLAAECEECVPADAKDLFPAVLDMVVDHAINVLDSVGDELDRVNRALFQHHTSPQRRLRLGASPRLRNRQVEVILTELGYSREVLVKLRRSVLSFRRLVGLMRERVTDDTIAKKLAAFEHELLSIAEAEVDLSSTAGFMLDGAVGYIGILQTKTINILTIVGVLLTPPVLVASVYGMNFKVMPELQWQWGYPWALGLMVASAIGMYVFVRVRGWL